MTLPPGELPACLAGYGLDCYTSPEAPGLTGEIKQRPEDFIVTELDSAGHLVTLSGTGGSHQAGTTAEAPLGGGGPCTDLPQSTSLKDQAAVSPPPCHEAAVSPPPCRDETPSDIVVPQLPEGTDHTPKLWELVSDEAYQQVVSMATRCSTTPTAESASSLSLGVVDDKELRTVLHHAVRLACPVLSSSTHRTATGRSEVCVAMDTNYPRLRDLLGHEEAGRLLVYLNVPSIYDGPHLLPPDPSKEHRTEVHRTLDELYGPKITTHSHTHTIPLRKKPRVQGGASGKGTRIAIQLRPRRKQRLREGGEEDQCTLFVLQKENVEMMEAVNMLCKALGCHASQLGYAGIKDARAITTQRMTVRGVIPSQVAALPSLPQISVGCIRPFQRHIQLGEHGGNHFKIRVRNLAPFQPLSPQQTLEQAVGECIRALGEKGFVNYFGPQRFGGLSLTSACIGLAMLQGHHMQAVNHLLSPGDDRSPATREAKQYFTITRDIGGCLQQMPSHKTRERLVLKALHHHGYSEYGCTRALCSIPYNIRTLFPHAFTSLLWNHLASFRIRQYGMEPVEGDLVLRPVQGHRTSSRDTVHMLTSADIQQGQYSVRDIVLPIVGTATILPGNKTADKLLELLAAVGLCQKSFRLKKLGLALPGVYRKLLQFPGRLQWRVRERGERGGGGREMGRGDVGVSGAATRRAGSPLAGCRMSDGSSEGAGESVRGGGEGVECGGEEGRCLEMELTLPPSCYATTMLRELMKNTP